MRTNAFSLVLFLRALNAVPVHLSHQTPSMDRNSKAVFRDHLRDLEILDTTKRFDEVGWSTFSVFVFAKPSSPEREIQMSPM